MKNKALEVSLFGGVVFKYQNYKYNLENHLTKQLLNLLEILILNYERAVTADMIENILWYEGGNPKSSLKYHVYKLRKALKQLPGFEDIHFILTTKGGYEFKPNIECQIDTYIFQSHYLCIERNSLLTKETLKNAETIEKIYQGLLNHDSDYLWFLQMKEFYHNIYIEIVHELCNYYAQNNMNESIKKITLKATRIDPMNEDNHMYYIQALFNLKEYNQALEYYQKMTKMLVDDYAMSLSKEMKLLYNVLINEIVEKKNVVAVIEQFKNRTPNNGAFYCEESLFNYLYDMKLRSSRRENVKYYLFVFEITQKLNVKIDIQKMKTIIQQSLRSGDIFTRISKFQFMALLPCESSDIGHSIAQRITKNIRKKVDSEKVKVHYYIDKVIDNKDEGK